MELLNAEEGLARIEWTPPAKDGGAAIEKYMIERKEGPGKWTQQSTITALDAAMEPAGEGISLCQYRSPGLKESVPYTFRVSAQNKAGPGPTSEPSDSFLYGLTYFYYSNSFFPFSLFVLTPFDVFAHIFTLLPVSLFFICIPFMHTYVHRTPLSN